ncbi:hypothetical protein [Cellulosimicrobium cellulans]|uniref:hypothetical protein n=1 Tax=Cellulosimicrobium cellulans TaxID=1710 RepID=UPI0038055FF2
MDAACELAGGTPWAEPLSTGTSLAFVVAGAAIVVAALRARRGTPSGPPLPDGAAAGSLRVAFGILVALVGAGSVVQHGPSPSWNPVVHDPPLLGALALVAADAVADLTGRRLRTWWWLAPTLLGVPLAAASPTASTGGPLGLTLQGHAVWHVLAAAALWLLAPTLGTRTTS